MTSTSQLPDAKPRVAVLGGGVAGLTVAHELALTEKFSVTVFEQRGAQDCCPAVTDPDEMQRAVLGGKAWSYPTWGVGSFKTAPPAEHGFRFFPGFYHHVICTMSKIPLPDGKGTVADALVPAQVSVLVGEAPHDGKIVTPVLTDADRAQMRFPAGLARWMLKFWWDNREVLPTLSESMLFGAYLVQFATSCQKRRDQQWEQRSWWDYVQAWGGSDEYRRWFAVGLTRSFVATRAEEMNARTGASILLQLLYDLCPAAKGRPPADRVLNGPTSQVWIGPWRDELTRLGVIFELNAEVDGLVVDDTAPSGQPRMAGFTLTDGHGLDGLPDGRTVTGFDYHVSAVSGERLQTLLAQSPRVADLDQTLAGVFSLQTRWMNGMTFYFKENVNLPRGHILCLDSQWALTLLEQTQFWDATVLPDGIKSIISVDISDWDSPGTTGVPARRMADRGELAHEVWRQLVNHLPELRDLVPDIEAFNLDRDIRFSGGSLREATNAEPLLVNVENSWQYRPTAVTEFTNFFVAGDFVRTHTDFASMEAANEAARRAVNALVWARANAADYAKLTRKARARHELVGPCHIRDLQIPDECWLWRRCVYVMQGIDRPLYAMRVASSGYPLVLTAKLVHGLARFEHKAGGKLRRIVGRRLGLVAPEPTMAGQDGPDRSAAPGSASGWPSAGPTGWTADAGGTWSRWVRRLLATLFQPEVDKAVLSLSQPKFGGQWCDLGAQSG